MKVKSHIYILELDDGTLVEANLWNEDEWCDIEVVRPPESKDPFVTVGKEKDPGDRDTVVRAWEYWPENQLDGKFERYSPITIREFAGDVIDMGSVVSTYTDDDCMELRGELLGRKTNEHNNED